MISPAIARTIPSTTLEQGMASPSMPFVQPDGTLTPVAFRFLFRLWTALSALTPAPTTGRLDALEARIAALEKAR